MSNSGEDKSQQEVLRLNLNEGRSEGATSWSLPPWGHPLSWGIFPLLISEEGRFTPIGTAFCISKLGVVATATHLVTEALRRHPRGQQILRRKEFPQNVDLGRLGLSVLHTWRRPGGKGQVSLWPLEGGNGAYLEDQGQPADILFSFLKSQVSLPYIPLAISLAVPRVGSKVKCFGYTGTRIAGGALTAQDFQSGAINDWFNVYQHSFCAIEGRVIRVFTQEFAKGYLGGACFAIDAEVGQGHSGGPVFNEAGYVCGVVSAGATSFFGQPSSLISPFYPASMIGIDCEVPMGLGRAAANKTLLEMVESETIGTDGSEEFITLVPDGDTWRVGVSIHDDDRGSAHDNFGGYQEALPATLETKSGYRVRRKDER